ncbi:hypothetical protein [Bradyrhizobium yuanmingense]|nr:hypothetical protein [Bradyrhizobium yuanmingense]
MPGDEDFTPMFLWLGAGFIFTLAAPIALLAFWQWVGPGAMLASFAAGFGCIFRGAYVGWQTVWRT